MIRVEKRAEHPDSWRVAYIAEVRHSLRNALLATARAQFDVLGARAKCTDDEMDWRAVARQAATLARVARRIDDECK